MLSDFFESFVRLTRSTTPSPLGGTIETWADGATIQLGISTNNSREAWIAHQNGMKTQYIIVAADGVTLNQNDQLRRVADGKTYRITSDSSDMHTPAVASLQYTQVTAEVIDL